MAQNCDCTIMAWTGQELCLSANGPAAVYPKYPRSRYQRPRQRGQFYRYLEQRFVIFNLPSVVMLSLHVEKMMLRDVSSNSEAKISLRGCEMCPGCLVCGYPSRGRYLLSWRSLTRPLFSAVVLHSPKHSWLPPLLPLIYRLQPTWSSPRHQSKPSQAATGSTLVGLPVLQLQLFLYETRRWAEAN